MPSRSLAYSDRCRSRSWSIWSMQDSSRSYFEPMLAWWLSPTWFGAIVLVTIGRAVLWWRYRRAPADGSAMVVIPGNARRLTCGSGLGIWRRAVFPTRSCLCAIVSDNRDRRYVRRSGRCQRLASTDLDWFFVRRLPADGGPFFAEGDPDDSAVGAMIVVFAVAMAYAGRHLNRILGETMRLRFELSEANQLSMPRSPNAKRHEAALDQAQKLEALGQLTGGIAHDFNNILAIIINNLDMAGKRLGENSCGRATDRRRGSGSRSRHRIDPTIAWLRAQTTPGPQPVDLARLIVGIEEMLRQALGPQILLSIDAPRHLAPAEVDSDQLELAILNFAITRAMRCRAAAACTSDWQNAADQTSPPELAPDDYLVISLTDTGTGMDDATLAKAFEPFFTTKKVGIGTGLGLPDGAGLCRAIGRSHATDECARPRHQSGIVAATRSNPGSIRSRSRKRQPVMNARFPAGLQRRQADADMQSKTRTPFVN